MALQDEEDLYEGKLAEAVREMNEAGHDINSVTFLVKNGAEWHPKLRSDVASEFKRKARRARDNSSKIRGDIWFTLRDPLRGESEMLAKAPDSVEAGSDVDLDFYSTVYYWVPMRGWEIPYYKGRSLAALGMHEEAIDCYDAAHGDPDRSGTTQKDAYLHHMYRERGMILVAKGNSLEMLGRYEEAIRCYDELLESEPTSVLVNKGCALMKIGRFQDAVDAFDRFFSEVQPYCSEALANKAYALARLGRHEESIKCYQEISWLDGHMLLNKGDSLSRAGRHDEAKACFDRAADTNLYDRMSGDFEYSLSTLYSNWMPFRTAKQTSCEDFLYKAMDYAEKNDYWTAIMYADKALAVDPDDRTALVAKGCLVSALGFREEAIDLLSGVAGTAPEGFLAPYREAGSLARLGRHEEAVVYYDRALGAAPGHCRASYKKGDSLALLGRHGDAMPCYDAALEAEPYSLFIARKKCNSLADLGRYGEAMGLYEEAREEGEIMRVTGDGPDVSLIDPGLLLRLDWGGKLSASSRALALKAHALMAAGYSLARLGCHIEEAGCYKGALELWPECKNADAAKDRIASLEGPGYCVRSGIWRSGKARDSIRGLLESGARF